VVGSIAYVIFMNVVVFIIFETNTTNRYIPRSSVMFSVLVVISIIVGVIPFMNYLFIFLDPQLVVTKIKEIGISAISKARVDANDDHVGGYQQKILDSVEQLRQLLIPSSIFSHFAEMQVTRPSGR
jgi:uncharacterized membrane protein